jgi:putative endonuclease
MKQYCVYILCNRNGTLYVGMTNDLVRRVYEHKHRLVQGFTCRYGIDRLVYYETGEDVRAVIAREKVIKGWRRSKKVALVERANPAWLDLSAGWYEQAFSPATPRCARGDRRRSG